MTLVAGLRAASYGIPFQPVAGVFGSDLARVNNWKTVTDPYSGKEVYAIPAIRPDIAVIHVNEVDEFGNARLYGTPFWRQNACWSPPRNWFRRTICASNRN